MAESIRVKVDADYALAVAKRLAAVGAYPESVCVEVLVADRLRLAQALRLLRDTGSEYTTNVCAAALDECGIEDPDEGHRV